MMADLPFKFQYCGNIITRWYPVNRNWTCKALYDDIRNHMRHEFNFKKISISINEVMLPHDSDIMFLNYSNRFNNFQFVAFHLTELHDEDEDDEEPTETFTCTVCCTNRRNVVFLPCRHLAVCHSCSGESCMTSCVICRAPVVTKLQIFIP